MVVKDKVLVSVGDIESAWERWETPLYLFRGMYESVTMVNMKFLRQRFFPSKMLEGTSVSQHLDKMKKIRKEFGAVRVKMPYTKEWSVTGKSASVIWVFDNHSLLWNSSLFYDWSDHFL